MKVLTAIVVAVFLVAAQAASQCHNKCSGGASSCQTKTEAAYCSKGYQLSSSNKCVKCGNVRGFFGTGNVGVAVGNGQWWEAWNEGLCTTCVTNCESCASKTTCAVGGCKPQFALVSATSCVACSANCDTCTSGTACTKCKAGFRLNNNACEACTQANCNKCDANKAKCDVGGCKAGFIDVNNGSCLSCAGAAAGTYISKTDNAGAGVCKTCTAGCGTCADATKCQTCANGDKTLKTLGHYLVTASKTCTQCTANCAKCTTNDSNKCDANSCFNGFQRKADGTCAACDTSKGNNWAADTCTQCDAHCGTCASNTACNAGQCHSGYVLDGNGKCQTCDVANCKTCTLANRTGANKKCQACKPSFINKDAAVGGEFKECVQCDANCNACQDTFKCQAGQCKTGYLRATNGKCVACNNGGNCATNTEMFPASNVGNGCNSFPLADGRNKALDASVTTLWAPQADTMCISCFAGCGTCNNVNGAGQCQVCSTNGYWPLKADGTPYATQNQALPNSCKACVANCANCGAHNTCTQCRDGSVAGKTLGFYLDTNTCKSCVANCAKCNANNAQCVNCFSGFQKSAKNTCVACSTDQLQNQGFHWDATGDGKCASCTASCKKCQDATNCQICKTGFRVNAGKCEQCTQANCNTCNTDKAKCDALGCATGFLRAADGNCVACTGADKHFTATGKGTCAQCDPNCTACQTATTCNANGCKSGYYTDANGKCQACGIANCAVCSAGTATSLCTTCKGKYMINAAKNACNIQCDAHATGCTDNHQAASCDSAKNYFLSTAKRCVYCAVPAKANGAADNAKVGNTWNWDGTYCATCDPNASGCAGIQSANACKTGYTVVGGMCVKTCATGQISAGGKGKCFACGDKVAAGRCGNYYDAVECTKGYHVQGSGGGKCCQDSNNSGAAGLFCGLSFITAAIASVFALLQ